MDVSFLFGDHGKYVVEIVQAPHVHRAQEKNTACKLTPKEYRVFATYYPPASLGAPRLSRIGEGSAHPIK